MLKKKLTEKKKNVSWPCVVIWTFYEVGTKSLIWKTEKSRTDTEFVIRKKKLKTSFCFVCKRCVYICAEWESQWEGDWFLWKGRKVLEMHLIILLSYFCSLLPVKYFPFFLAQFYLQFFPLWQEKYNAQWILPPLLVWLY
jgi:hypothetical protein